MSKTLVIMESPVKCKTVQQYLGKDYKVVSCNGHISVLKKTGPLRLGIDLDTFTPHYRIDPHQKELFKKLTQWSTKAKKVILATDPDREGEAIAQHLQTFLELDGKSARVRFNEITKEGILEAFTNEQKINANLVKAQETRRILDRLIGFRLSYFLYKKVKTRSAGRVQSVCLKLIVEREQLRTAFQFEEYWTVEGIIHNNPVTLTKHQEQKISLPNLKAVQALKEALGPEFVVRDIVYHDKIKKPFAPYYTSTLMQDASTILGFSAARTSLLAQKLYEGVVVGMESKSLITYPRTDSTRLANRFIKTAQSYIKKTHGVQYLAEHFNFKIKGKNIQDAHEAIRITDVNLTPNKLGKALAPPALKLYTLIYNRSLAALMKPAVFEIQKIKLTNNEYLFNMQKQVVRFDGHLLYSNQKYKNDGALEQTLHIGDQLTATKLEALQHFTIPPLRYTEAKLIQALETLGIGRPSTYAVIINVLFKRGYVVLNNKSLVPQPKGILTNEVLQKWFSNIINEQYTAHIEQDLTEIALGKLNNFDILHDFWQSFNTVLTEALEKMEEIPLEKVNKPCPKCGLELVYRNGRFGKFIGCLGFPKCFYNKSIGEDYGSCPKCEMGKLVIKFNKRNQKFLACSLYRETKCDYIDRSKLEASKKAAAATADKKKKTIKLSLI